MANNKTQRNIYLAIAIASTIGLIAFFVSKICGINVSMWVYGFDVGVMLVSYICYLNFRQAVKEDEKYGKQ